MLASEFLVINQEKITLEEKLKLHLNMTTGIDSTTHSRDQSSLYEKSHAMTKESTIQKVYSQNYVYKPYR